MKATPKPRSDKSRKQKVEIETEAAQSHLKATPKRVDSQGIATPKPPLLRECRRRNAECRKAA
jgi:hypothetical protein